jgi:hypothetical protein
VPALALLAPYSLESAMTQSRPIEAVNRARAMLVFRTIDPDGADRSMARLWAGARSRREMR